MKNKEAEDKFDDCKFCAFKFKKSTVCKSCDTGENFEEIEMEDLREIIHD